MLDSGMTVPYSDRLKSRGGPDKAAGTPDIGSISTSSTSTASPSLAHAGGGLRGAGPLPVHFLRPFAMGHDCGAHEFRHGQSFEGRAYVCAREARSGP